MRSQRTTEDATLEQGVRRYRATVRTRLALTYSLLLTGAGAIMLASVYLFMRFVPNYNLVEETAVPTTTQYEPTTATSVLPGGIENGGEAAATVEPSLAITISSPEQMLNVLLIISGVVLVILAIVGTWVGWAIAGRILKPLQYINTAMNRATQGDLQQRIRLGGPRDEISELAANFDEMLAQLERSFTASRRFAANASHELLTPLATTKAMLDVALAQQDDPDDRLPLERLDIMNNRSIETVGALLQLAKIESSNESFENVDLADIAQQVAEICASEASEGGVRIDLDLETAPVEGDPVLIRQLLTNLVLNAIRHNQPTGGFLSVKTRPGNLDGHVTVEVENSGVLLDDEVVAALTGPFTRSAGRLSSSSKGHGLGLSIVAAIIERMHGILNLSARPSGGMLVVAAFPAPEQPRD